MCNGLGCKYERGGIGETAGDCIRPRGKLCPETFCEECGEELEDGKCLTCDAETHHGE